MIPTLIYLILRFLRKFKESSKVPITVAVEPESTDPLSNRIN